MGHFSLPILPKLPEDSNVVGETGHLRASTTFVEVRAVAGAGKVHIILSVTLLSALHWVQTQSPTGLDTG